MNGRLNRVHRRMLVVAWLAAVSPGSAQDAAVPAAAPAADPRLADALVAKVASCYEAEAGALDGEDRALLQEFAPELLAEFGPALATFGCGADGAACARLLSGLDCALLAQPIVTAGYDQIEPLAPDPVIAAYARSLAERVVACSWDGALDEAAQVHVDYVTTHLEIALSMRVVAGGCRVHPEAREACIAGIQQLACPALLSAESHVELTADSLIGVCAQLLTCTPPDAGAPPPTP
jgi:hypothetical protein